MVGPIEQRCRHFIIAKYSTPSKKLNLFDAIDGKRVPTNQPLGIAVK